MYKKKVHKLKMRWSILRAWEEGRTGDVIAMIFGKGKVIPNKAMQNGIDIHKKIEESKKAPYLLLPSKELKFEVTNTISINEILDYQGTVDMWDSKNKIIYDWKTGKSGVLAHKKMQLYCYSLLFPEAKWGAIVKISDDLKTEEVALYKFNSIKREEAKNYIATLGYEIFTFAESVRNNNFRPF